MTDFDAFWAAYPNKKSKARARDVEWPRAVKKADFEVIMAGLERYRIGKEPWRAWMHPSTWLHNECWEDEYEALDRTQCSFVLWTAADIEGAGAFLENVGPEQFLRHGYKPEHLNGLRAEGYLQPKEVAG